MSNGKRSKAKGSSFEREICKRLSLWISNGTAEDCLWRSAMSGGRSTVAGKRGANLSRQAGDISAISPEGHALTDKFFVECKHVKNLNVRGLVTGKGLLWSFWIEACSQAATYSKSPLLIAKQNNWATIVCTSHTGLALLNAGGIRRLQVSPEKETIKMHVVLLEDLLAQNFALRKGVVRMRLTMKHTNLQSSK